MHLPADRQRGFTLIEAMIAVAILAIVAAIAIPAYNGYITTSRLGVARSNMDSLRMALEDYKLDNNSYVGGSWSGGSGTLGNNLGWRPEGDQDRYTYNVITTANSTSYSVVVTEISSNAWVRCDNRMQKCCDSSNTSSSASACP